MPETSTDRVVLVVGRRGRDRARNPARRIGAAADIADAVLFASTNGFRTGVTPNVGGGEALT